MSGITATELELLACFGVEPRLRDADVPWCYNDAAYLVEMDGLSVSFAVQPSNRDVHLTISRGERRLFEFNAAGVADVRVVDERGLYEKSHWSNDARQHAAWQTEAKQKKGGKRWPLEDCRQSCSQAL